MTALRAEGQDGSIEFDWQSVTIARTGRRAKKNPPLSVPIVGSMRVFLREPKTISFGQFAVLDAEVADPKKHETGPTIVMFSKPELMQFRHMKEAIELALGEGDALSPETIASFEERTKAEMDASRAEAEQKITELRRKMMFAQYGGYLADHKGFRHVIGIKRDIAGASAEYESGADRSRPTLTRIGAGALLAGPVGAIAGGMFKKDRTKGYVTVIFPDGATVIIDGPAKDEKKMREFANAINMISEMEQSLAGASAEPVGVVEVGESPADQLLKLKQLLDAGVLTEEQYAEKSAPLIASL